MPSIKSILSTVVVGLAATASAIPYAIPKIDARQAPTNPAEIAAGLTDIDILIFANTLEWLEFTFYQEGFQKFSDDEFLALGLSQEDLTSLKGLQDEEGAHVALLLGAIASAGFEPPEPCEYNFGFTTAADMVAIAIQLEEVGLSAYLGAAGLISSSAILTTAAQITTTEGRHQTAIRIFSKLDAAPRPLDTPLSPQAIFTLASQFITSCPTNSQLKITAFDKLTASNVNGIKVNDQVQITSDTKGATHCAFTSGGASTGGTAFTPITGTQCPVPPDVLEGFVYLHVATPSASNLAGGILADAEVKAGTLILQIS